jgi:hypothetical protein
MDLAVAQVDLGLVVHDELVAGQGDPQLLHRLQPGGEVDFVCTSIDVMAVPVSLGLVHGHVGFAQQGAQIGAVGGEQSDTDAGGAVDRYVLQVEGLAQRRAELDRDGRRLVAAGVVEQDHELVATKAHKQVLGTQVLAQADTHLDQQLIPYVVPRAVVDLLEPVQVQEQQRLPPMLRVRKSHPCSRVQGPPVRQARQVVGAGLRAQHVQVTHLAGGYFDRPFEGIALVIGFVIGRAEGIQQVAPRGRWRTALGREVQSPQLARQDAALHRSCGPFPQHGDRPPPQFL